MADLVKIFIDIIKEFLKWETYSQARVFAYIIAPCSAFAAALLLSGGQAGLYLSIQPIKVVRLKSESDGPKTYVKTDGALIFLEPIVGEYHFVFESPPRTVLTSMSPERMGINSERLRVGPTGISALPPFLGEGGATVIAFDGKLSERFFVPGGDRSVDEVIMPSDQATSVATGVVFACLFALGVAFSTLFPLVNCSKDITSKEGA